MKQDREDKYTIVWDSVEAGESSTGFRYATLAITELWSIGHLVFDTPLKIQIIIGKRDDDAEETALATYDFGMDQDIALTKNRNFLYNYAEENEEGDQLKTVFGTIKFDLMHAFFHYAGDPNYGHLHWALYGNLKDRVTADDNFIIDDWEKQNGIQ